MALLPELPAGGDKLAIVLSSVLGIFVFLWRFFYGAKRDVRNSGDDDADSKAHRAKAEAYDSIIVSLREENAHQRLLKDEAELRQHTAESRQHEVEKKLHDLRGVAADMKMENYKLKLVIKNAGINIPDPGADHDVG